MPGGSHVDVAHSFSGGDKYVGDYLRSEFLRTVSRLNASILVRHRSSNDSAVRSATPPSARTSPGRVLDRLERNNLLVIPLDRRGEWYRYHHLFRDLLQTELQRREPEILRATPVLQPGTRQWLPPGAIADVQDAGDPFKSHASC